jgi:hypothetical protein
MLSAFAAAWLQRLLLISQYEAHACALRTLVTPRDGGCWEERVYTLLDIFVSTHIDLS